MSPEKPKRGPGRPRLPEAGADDPDSEVMTVRQVAQYLNCRHHRVYRLMLIGGLPRIRLGCDWRFLRSDLERWVAQQRAQRPSEEPAGEHQGRGRPRSKPKPRI
jgi:excisionase family DNA binding protein